MYRYICFTKLKNLIFKNKESIIDTKLRTVISGTKIPGKDNLDFFL
jgi:hypothetical protein